MRQRYNLAMAAFLFVVAELIAFSIDQPVARFMADISPSIERLFKFITWFGQGGVILYPTGIIILTGVLLGLAFPSLRDVATPVIRRATVIFAAVGSAGLVNDALKILFGRARPYLWLNGDMSGFHMLRYGAKFASFPSGHTATSVAAAIILSAIFPRGRYVFAIFAALIALSRIILDAHYVSDVIAAFAVGGIVAIAVRDYARTKGWLVIWQPQDSEQASVQ